MPRPNRGPHLKPDRATGVYYIHWTDNGRSRRKSTQQRRKVLAEDALERFLRERRSRRLNRERVTVTDAWETYCTERVEPRVVDKARLGYAWKALAPYFANRIIAELTTADINEYKRTRADEGVAQSTIRRELGALVSSFNWLIKTKRIPSDEAPYIELPPKSAPGFRWLRAEEIDQLYATAVRRREASPVKDRLSRLERYLHVALETGARPNVVYSLQWAQVDFERRVIDFGTAGVQTKKRKPAVPISSRLLPVLKRAYNEKCSEHVLDHAGKIRRTFESAVAAAELAPTVTPMTLRHTFASHAIMNGASYTDVARVLGNTAAMVEQVYAKFQPEYLQSVVELRPVRLKVV